MKTELTEEKFHKLKRDVDEAKASADRSQGRRDQLIRQLKEEFECASVGDAKKLLVEMEQEQESAEKDFNKAMTDYERKWEK